jgi:hypothetical protein
MNLDLSHIDPDVLATCSEVDKIEYAICQWNDQQSEKFESPITNVFTPGIYARTVFFPAGTIGTSVTHNTRHPFIISSGEADVISPDGVTNYIAPYMGITEPGTKRLIHAKKDVTWTTFHANPNNITDPDEIMKMISIELNNPLLDSNDPRCRMWSELVSPSFTINAINEEFTTKENELNINRKKKLCLDGQ